MTHSLLVRCTMLGTLLLLSLPLHAQSLGLGAGQFRGLYPTALADVSFDSDVYVAGFYGRATHLQAFTGTDEQPGLAGDSVSVRLFGADLFTGGNPTLVRIPGELPVQLFIPVRFGAGYRYVDLDDRVGVQSSTAHIGEGTLGIGGGIGLDVPAAMTSGVGAVRAEAAYVASAGVAADLRQDSPDPLAVRAGTLSLGLQVSRVLGSQFGASVGLLHRVSKRSGPLDTGGDFIEAVTGGGSLADFETTTLMRFGLAF